MEITVKNYRGCESAELALAPIALVCGHNEAGKTSIAQAVSAALTRNGAPIEGIAKNAARMLLRDGASRGNCRVWDDTGFAQANWPGASVSEEGDAPRATEIACGLISLLDMKPAERSALLIRVMDALPDREQLAAAVADSVPEQVVKAVWGVIEADGWDAAWKRSKSKGAELKGAWGQITSETWGAKKGEDWMHPILGDGPVNLDGLQQAVTDAGQQLEDAIANQAADGARRQMLEERAAAALESPAPHEEERDRIHGQLAKLDEEASALPRPQHGQGGDCSCPHCGEALVVQSRTDVRKPEQGLSDEENQNRQDALEQTDRKRQELNQQLGVVTRKIGDIAQQARDVARAKQELEAMASGTVTPEQIAEAREKVQKAQQAVQAAQASEAAAKKHREIVQNAALTAALAPDGLRQQVLAAKLAAFNKSLAMLSAEGGWPTVKVEGDLSVTYGGRAYVLLSASAQFRVRTTLQLAIANMDGSDAVVIDAADILDKKGRNGLFSAVRKAKVRALICMTMDDQGLVPDLAKASIGRSYWIGGAVLAPISN